MQMMNYAALRQINVNSHVEKKHGLSYLSWAWAVDQLLLLDSDASWEYAEPKWFGESLMVFCTVTAFGKKRTAQLPVMDFYNRPISLPDAYEVNTAMQRCLAKAISLHGIGLYLYAGEDLPMPNIKEAKEAKGKSLSITEPKDKITPIAGALDHFSLEEKDLLQTIADKVTALVKDKELIEATQIYESLTNDEKVGLWSLLDSKTRAALKKYKRIG